VLLVAQDHNSKPCFSALPDHAKGATAGATCARIGMASGCFAANQLAIGENPTKSACQNIEND
jgi:hypothetical protein